MSSQVAPLAGSIEEVRAMRKTGRMERRSVREGGFALVLALLALLLLTFLGLTLADRVPDEKTLWEPSGAR